MKLTPSQEKRLHLLITFLSLSTVEGEFSLAFIQCDDQALRDQISKIISEQLLNTVQVLKIEMDKEHNNFFQLYEELSKSDVYAKLDENKNIAVFVEGIDEAIKKKNSRGYSESLVILNLMREKLLEIKHPVLFWINSRSLISILADAPDFFSWRTTVISF